MRPWRCRRVGACARAILLASLCCGVINPVVAQEPVDEGDAPQKLITPTREELSPVAAKVDVAPVAQDEQIRRRLQTVLHATDWFTDPQVRVEEGVVFLNGLVESDELKQWAGDLARNTQDVVAVANRLEVPEPSVWDFRQASSGLSALWRDFIRAMPFVLFGLLILALSVGAALLAIRIVRVLLRHRIQTKLLQTVIARAAGGLVVLSGVYLILRVSGLTQLALTLVGGTGLIGLILGIAFRDITENFLSSIFLSIQQPFETGDLVEISGVTGYVQQLNMRTTVLMTLDGTLAQIPNATVYKAIVSNFTTSPNRRADFMVGIGYDDAIAEAQEIARKVLSDHPAVLNDPEPSVLADSLGGATVNLRLYFWLNGREHSLQKVRSSVIRLVKRAFQNQGISMPDEAREVVFPQGIPVTVLPRKATDVPSPSLEKRLPAESRHAELEVVSTKAEAGLYSESIVIEEQAREAGPLKDGENLLPVTTSDTADSGARRHQPT
ncbi:mechanosensitive ion channel family protein [Allochromatium vinosum]|uniref:Small-conductance mechanosensitive channel n=1 Tax=Allochromatium vinosum (strain ATCC 17899 / DSM 180 / NBRC 103801 / NCIMB 10441 / D) TaxID=572477 RepID=D3RR41_ALLVD|nr:mechanosensitive ion channel family protein [Allochromatium vinosum]ADC61869.1 MscS Mechanosensitive ion channel [Allochromatium vinosum DSM 180]